jgi:S-adenosylmethionine hydrolase
MGGPPIVLTTDFGLSDPYVGMMKGVILSINPHAVAIDLTHHIHPQNIQQAAFILGVSWRFFPRGSIHVVVVDPGVGTDRKAVLLITPSALFLGPDNGVFSYVLAEHLDNPADQPGFMPMPNQCSAYQLTNPEYWRHPVSSTFHGRDVFAPVAAHLSLGVKPETVGSPVSELVWLPRSQPLQEGNRIHGEVIYADHFGNLITNIHGSLVKGEAPVLVEIKGHEIPGLSRTFHDDAEPTNQELLALIGSHGHLEIAVPNGSAALALKAGPGEPVIASWLQPGMSL